MGVLMWFATYGTVEEITENDEGYDWSKDGTTQLAWYPEAGVKSNKGVRK